MLFRFQVGVVYTFAGLAKAQSDWLLHAQPLRSGSARARTAAARSAVAVDGAPLLMSWAGFLFDTTIIWFLLWRAHAPVRVRGRDRVSHR